MQYMHILTLHRMLVQKGNDSDNGTKQYVQKGDTIRSRPNLSATLRAIVQNGFDEFYTGMTATKLVNDISSACAGHPHPHFCRELQDIITSDDLAEYKAKPRTPLSFHMITAQDMKCTLLLPHMVDQHLQFFWGL